MSLTSILFPEYRRRVLGLLLLHPERRYHVREIARLTGTVPGTLARELTKLMDAGLLRKEGIGRQVFYGANRECLIFDELASILRKTSGLVDVLADALLPLIEHVETAFVFGSIASGLAGDTSDIDLMVIGDVSFSSLNAALYPIQDVLGREINPKIYLGTEWRKLVANGDPFVQEVLNRPRLLVVGVMDDFGKSEGADAGGDNS